MKAFWIIAAIITAAYVVYYAVLICIDLYRKPEAENTLPSGRKIVRLPCPQVGLMHRWASLDLQERIYANTRGRISGRTHSEEKEGYLRRERLENKTHADPAMIL